MKTYKFIVAKHEEFGTLGLRPAWYPNGDPLSGKAAAHDILEHFPKDDGSAEGELMALGASNYVRGDGGYNNGYRYYNRVEDPGSEIPDVWSRLVNREGRTALKSCGVAREGMADARAMIDYGRNDFRERFGDEAPSTNDKEVMARWVARGYVKAQRRYRRVIGDACALGELFTRIERGADAALKRAEEGEEMLIYVNIKRCEVRIDCDYPKEAYQ